MQRIGDLITVFRVVYFSVYIQSSGGISHLKIGYCSEYIMFQVYLDLSCHGGTIMAFVVVLVRSDEGMISCLKYA